MSPTFRLITSLRACFALSAAFAASLCAQETPLLFEPDQKVPMRDGVSLSANVFRPKGEGRFPVILMRTPYGKRGEDWGDARRYVRAGYALVSQDCRGRGKSEGKWDPFRYDVEDGHDTQEWVAKQPWCNGDIGTTGGSYEGWTQWSAAPGAGAHLKAMVPLVPFDNAFEIAYNGGAFQLALLMGWGSGVGGVMLAPDKLQEALRHLPLNTFGDQFEKKVPYLNDWVTHSSYDEYWKQRGIDGDYKDIGVPILNIGGWYDIFSKSTLDQVVHMRSSSRDLKARRNQFVVMGPWAHAAGTRKTGELDFGADAALNLGELQFKWFEYWLKGHETGVQDWPPIYLFVMGENKWRGETEWPPKRAHTTSYFLRGSGHANTSQGDGALATAEPEQEAADHYTYDPNNPLPSTGGNNLLGATSGPWDQAKVEQRDDVLVYTTPALDQDVEVTGPVKLTLYAASSARDTDFTAKLVDVHEDGKAYNLCEGILRARYRHGLDHAELLEPDRPERFDIDLWVTSNVFKRGHRIRLEVSSSNFPRFDRNPNSGKLFGTDTELFSARQTVFHDKEHLSQLLLPVIPR